MIGQIIVTTIGLVALVIGLWTIKQMKDNQKPHIRNRK